MKKLCQLIAFFLLCLLAIISCSSKEDKPFTIALPSEPNTLDPLYATDLMSRKLNRILFSHLFRKIGNGKIEKELVKNYNFIGNSLKLKIESPTIRAKDAQYSLQRAIQENHPTKSQFQIIRDLKVISENELQIDFSGEPNSILELLTSTEGSIYKATHRENKEFISDGKYKLKSWIRNNLIDLQLNQENKNFPNQLRLRFLQNPASAIYLFNRKKIDILKIPYYMAFHPSLNQSDIRFIKGKSIQYIAINHKDKCFDSHFRKALQHAVDRKKIINTVFDSFASEIYYSFPKEYLDSSIESDKFAISFDLGLAKEELQKSSCYPKILNRELEFRMRGDDENKAKGPAIIKYFRDIGLKIKILPMEKAPLYKENSEGKGDLTLLTWYIDYDSALNFIDPILSSDSFGNGGNRSFYQNNSLDAIIQTSRKNLYLNADNQRKVLEILQSENPILFLWSLHENYLVPKSFSTNLEWETLLF